MSETDRRTVLRLAMLAALTPAMLPQPAVAAAPGLIAPPTGSMRYRRAIERGLAGGARIMVEREFRIAFTQVEAGFVIDGEQTGVETAFPPGLEKFAEIEAARVPTGLFPLLLDPFGHIISAPEAAPPDLSLKEAVALAMDRIRQQRISPGEKEELLQFVETLHQAGGALIAALPSDLFAPAEANRSERQDVTLPTGEHGQVVSRFIADRDSATGLMREAMREVLTEIAGDRRETRERWILARA